MIDFNKHDINIFKNDNIKCNIINYTHCHLLYIVSYVPNNDIIFSQSAQDIDSLHIKIFTLLIEKTICVPQNYSALFLAVTRAKPERIYSIISFFEALNTWWMMSAETNNQPTVVLTK